MGHPFAKLAPTGQNMRDGGIRVGGPMGLMGVVHGDHIGDHLGVADEAGEIGDHVQPASAADQKRRMGNVVNANTEILKGGGEGRIVQVFETGVGIGDRKALARFLGLGGGRGCKARHQAQTECR